MTTGGCGGGCRCAGDAPDTKNDTQCATPIAPLILDENGKCPCGKTARDCCHKDELTESDHNQAIDELCEAPLDEPLCATEK